MHKFRVVETIFYFKDYTYEVEAKSESDAAYLVRQGNEVEVFEGELQLAEDSDISEVTQLS